MELKPRFTGASGRLVSFADGSTLEVDAVIWATGYRSDYSWIDAPVFDSDGRVKHRRGVTDVPGLYFLGMPWQYTRGSALIGWVKSDAEFIGEQIEASAKARPARARTARTPDTWHERRRLTWSRRHFPERPPVCPTLPVRRSSTSQDGDEFDLRIEPVAKKIGEDNVRMLAYNGSIPGPTLKVRQDSEIIVHVRTTATRGDRALARPATRQRLRRHARDPGPDRRSAGSLHLPSCSFPDAGAVLVPPPHPRGLRPRHGPLRQHRRRTRRPRLLAARRIANSPSRSTTS